MIPLSSFRWKASSRVASLNRGGGDQGKKGRKAPKAGFRYPREAGITNLRRNAAEKDGFCILNCVWYSLQGEENVSYEIRGGDEVGEREAYEVDHASSNTRLPVLHSGPGTAGALH